VETGLKTMVIKTNKDTDYLYHRLSILLTQSGLSFLYLKGNKIDKEKYFKIKASNKYSEETELIIAEELHQIKEATLDEVVLIYQNIDFNLIPNKLTGGVNSILHASKYNLSLQAEDDFSQDSSFNNEISVSFVPLININNLIFDRFGEFNHTHQTNLYLKAAETYKSAFSDCICFVNNHQVDIVIIKKQKLQLYNTFKISTEEDAIYYILYCLEINEMNRESIETIIVNFSDQLKLEKINSLLEPYIKHVNIKDFAKASSNPHLSNHKFLNELCA
jgi:hypothetical protein